MKKVSLSVFGALLISAQTAMAADAPKIDTGDTAWVLVSAALVLLMTPGLAFFYGGMVQTRNVVSTLFQSFISIGVVGIIWALVGYSLVFSGDSRGLIGKLNWAFLRSVGPEPMVDYAATIPHQAFMLFQCMFAVITPALITGAFAERMKFKAWLIFIVAWSLLVYVPVAHWVWGIGGWIRNLGALDFAGGMVVHMTAGFSALTAALMFRKRRSFKAPTKPYDVGMILLGTGLLLFGWFGFNAGSALGANGLAAQAFATTFFAAAAAMVAWTLTDLWVKGKPSAVGAAIGCVAGLVAITPAAGFVTPMGAIAIGIITATICNFAIATLKERLKIDDTLDVFGCHGIGGLLGTILTGIFASKSVNPAGGEGLIYGNVALLKTQLLASLGVALVSIVGTYAVIKLTSVITSLQSTSFEEIIGLDYTEHAEVINANFDLPQAPESLPRANHPTVTHAAIDAI